MRSSTSSTPVTARKASKTQRPAGDGLSSFTVPKLKVDPAPWPAENSTQRVHIDRHTGKENRLLRPAVRSHEAELPPPKVKMQSQAVTRLQRQQAMSDWSESALADMPLASGQDNTQTKLQLASKPASVPASMAVILATASGRPHRGTNMPVNNGTHQPGIPGSDLLLEDHPLACQTAITKRRSDIIAHDSITM